MKKWKTKKVEKDDVIRTFSSRPLLENIMKHLNVEEKELRKDLMRSIRRFLISKSYRNGWEGTKEGILIEPIVKCKKINVGEYIKAGGTKEEAQQILTEILQRIKLVLATATWETFVMGAKGSEVRHTLNQVIGTITGIIEVTLRKMKSNEVGEKKN